MTQIETLKAQAKNLRHAMTKMGMAISLAQSLEAIAQQYGVENWDTLAGIVNKAELAVPPVRTLAQLPSVPYKVEVRGCSGLYFECRVKRFDAETLVLVHDKPALGRYLMANPEKYPDGFATTAIELTSDGRDFAFPLFQLLYMKFGDDNWFVDGALLALRFHCREDKPTKLEGVELAIPQMVKSAKGCQLLILPSHDGGHYDKHIIVPPHLDVDVISQKMVAEIRRLKELDAAHADDENYDEFTSADLARFAASIGGLWVGEPKIASENWDC